MRISDWSSDVCSSDLPYFSGGDEAAQEFCSHFDLDSGCGPLIARIEQLIQARNEKDQLARANRAVDSGGKPLDLGNLALLGTTIAQADLSAMTSRQPICEVGADGGAVPLFYEPVIPIRRTGATAGADQTRTRRRVRTGR